MLAEQVRGNQIETDVAVLQIQVKHIDQNLAQIKSDVREVHDCLHKNSEETHKLLKEMQAADNSAHKGMTEKISALEKWRWMMMGAGVVIGSLGFDTIAKLLK